jgi:hypothetical protein
MKCNTSRVRVQAIWCLAVAVLAALAMPAFAQETTGTIKGRIVDAQGLAVPGANVTVTGPQGSKAVVTDTEGRFNIPFLTPGKYTVRTELQGFKAAEQKDVVVGLGQTVDLPVKMEVGGVAETVQVIGSSPIVDTGSTTTGAVLSSDMIDKVPVGRRRSALGCGSRSRPPTTARRFWGHFGGPFFSPARAPSPSIRRRAMMGNRRSRRHGQSDREARRAAAGACAV